MEEWKRTLSILTLLLLLSNVGGAMATNKPQNPKFIPTPSYPKLVITSIQAQPTTCGGKTTVSVTLNNYGRITGVGTLKIYVDGNLATTIGTEVNPYTPVTERVKVPVQPGTHTFKAEVTNPTGSSSEKVTTTTIHSDWDCDYLSDSEEQEYGTNPYNKDTDGDGIIDSQDMNPLGNYKITVYILRARALEDVDSRKWSDPGTWVKNPADMSLNVTVNGQSKTLFLTNNLDDSDKNNKPLVSGPNLIDYLNKYAIAKATFNVPDDKETVPITFNLYDRDDNGKIDEMDVSPGPDYIARIYYNLKTGTWSGDDYPGDEWEYYGYGHLSGCGDGSCGIGPKDPEKDVKVYSKYQSVLEKNGIKGEILSVHSSTKVSEVRWGSKRSQILVRNPRKVTVVQVLLPDGTIKNVTLVNTYGARTIKLNPIKLPKKPDVAEAEIMPANVSAEALTEASQVKLPEKVVTYSSSDYPDGEIWFVIVPNDPDLIPFWREVELNQELEEKGISWRFDPSDGYWAIDEPPVWVSVNEMDEEGDYDGDGVPNEVEQLIGKDPAKRDILGISLTVSTEWSLSDEDKRDLVYSIRKASDFVYDYTDGYAMITSVQIWDDKRHWEDADVRVHETGVLPQTPFETRYPGWQKSTAGGYWMKRSPNVTSREKSFINIIISKKYQSGPGNGGSIGDVSWGRTLGHELGHYVFWLGDEYMDWHGHTYQLWYFGMLEAVAVGSIEIVGAPPTLILEYYAYKIRADDFMSIHSVMNKQWKWSELSTPKDYEKFKKDADELWDKTSIIWKLKGYTSSKDMLTDQWGDPNKTNENSDEVDPRIWHSSAWETVYKILTSNNLKVKACIPQEDTNKGKYGCVYRNILLKNNIPVAFTVNSRFKPKTGPYTGVGYFMGVIWG